MPAYRFCRSDDIPLLVRAHDACYRVHFSDLPELTVAGFKRAIRDLDLWTSSCMVAFSDEEPIGVLLAGKRETESLLYRVGVRPDRVREGHGRHMLDSLRQKLAILGPRKIVAEVPAGSAAARSFLEACGYACEGTYTDFVLQPEGGEAPPSDLVAPVSVDEMLEHDLLQRGAPRCWQRSAEALVRRRDEIAGLAMVSDERIEGYLLYHEPEPDGTREIVALHCALEERAGGVLGTLLRLYGARGTSPVRIVKVDPREISFELLERWGFRPTGQTARYVLKASEEDSG